MTLNDIMSVFFDHQLPFNDQTSVQYTRDLTARQLRGLLSCAVGHVIRSLACGRKIAVGRLTVSPRYTENVIHVALGFFCVTQWETLVFDRRTLPVLRSTSS